MNKKELLLIDDEQDTIDGGNGNNFWLDFGEAGGSLSISAKTLTSFNYSINGGSWEVVNPGGKITIPSGKVYLCAMTPVTRLFSSDSTSNAWTISGTNVKAGGNINMLLNADDPDGVVYSPYTFSSMFYGCTGLTQAPELPATMLANYCYDSMFQGCTGLTQAPALPATTLADWCYHEMFYGCRGLTQAPDLPATTLVDCCYYRMFYGCRGLTQAPELPATTLASHCYSGMFDECINLTQAPELPATTLAYGCYSSMFEDCWSLTQAPELSSTTLANYCYYRMFHGSGLTQAPELPATTLANYCYGMMFYGCRSLTYIKCLATNISASDCVDRWVSGVATSGTFVKNAAMTSWPSGTSGIPSGWTVQDT